MVGDVERGKSRYCVALPMLNRLWPCNRFKSIVKPESFYESHSESDPRRYFYNVDLQGRLFLEETIPKNIATSIKDERFLDFFFRMIRPVGPRELEIMNKFEISQDEYPFVSPCGKELNFIRPAATPIVYHSFNQTDMTLIYAGTKTEEFRASGLAISKKTGRLYHRCKHLELLAAKATNQCAERSRYHRFALIRSAIVVALSEHIVPLPDDMDRRTKDDSELAFILGDHVPQPIPWLPDWDEPGSWAMPFSEDGSDN